jgi:hypothetical protein
MVPWVAATDFILIWIVYSFSPGIDGKLAWVAGLLAIGFACSGFFFLWQWHHEASQALGVRVTSGNSPPSDWVGYQEWCRLNDVTPLSERT